ncbi:MAG: transcription-repair coupling factor, partial [Pseudomonadota bacterium]|nr:transcription-repair coupling factor [Pseudomonadota bacterium]
MNSPIPGTRHPSPGAALSGVPAAAEPLALAELLAGKYGSAPKTILHIAASDRALGMMEAALSFFAPGAEILRFPAWDCLPYDRASPLPSLMADRIRTLATLTKYSPLPTPLPQAGAGEQRIILTTASAVLQKLPPRGILREAAFPLERNRPLDRDALVAHLISHGYRRSGKAMEPGEFALRGGIIDIVPPGMSEGVRVDLSGDDIETIRPFDPLTQITKGALEKIALHPASEIRLTAETIEHFRNSYRERFGAVGRDDPFYEAVSQGQYYIGMEHWLPLF